MEYVYMIMTADGLLMKGIMMQTPVVFTNVSAAEAYMLEYDTEGEWSIKIVDVDG